ncbi:M20/M25/M40 family metallo-hydrolase [Chitinophagaceae bacterium MMS25-I14]
MKQKLLPFLLVLSALSSKAQDSLTLQRISDEVLLHGTCYDNLRVLCKTIGHRLSGTPEAAKAVQWAQAAMEKAGADRVWLQAATVPVWVRGKEELQLSIGDNGKMQHVTALSLGNSEGTGGKLLEAPIVMVNNFEEFNTLDERQVKGKIVFFNYRFRQDLVHTFEGYGDAVKYRWASPSIAAGKGAAGVIIRSISTGADDVPHTGSMRYIDSLPKIPEMSIGNLTADKLEAACKKGNITARMKSECHMAGTAPSYNVIGELTGSEHPEQVIVAGGHLDSWDVGEGAHDDGAGCVESIEIIRTLKALNIRPKRTIRVVLFMNEENGARGGAAYADSAKARHEDHILAIETDAGGFSPRGFGMEMSESKKTKIRTRFAPQLMPFGVYDFTQNEGGADISFLQKNGVPVMGLLPDPQRYFDIHHTNSDVFEAVNHRELKLGAVAMTAMTYLVSEYGL